MFTKTGRSRVYAFVQLLVWEGLLLGRMLVNAFQGELIFLFITPPLLVDHKGFKFWRLHTGIEYIYGHRKRKKARIFTSSGLQAHSVINAFFEIMWSHCHFVMDCKFSQSLDQFQTMNEKLEGRTLNFAFYTKIMKKLTVNLHVVNNSFLYALLVQIYAIVVSISG